MSTATKPVLNVTVSLEIEVEYDPFSGRTKQQLADKKQRKEELRKLYRDGVISEPSAEPPVKFNFGRLYDFEK